jgi:hypothetical protein
MKALQTLIKIHQQNPSRMLELWKKENKTGKMMQLYECIQSDVLTSDIQASIFFYKAPNHANYRRLKHALKKKLIELLQFVPVDDFHNPTIKTAFKMFIISILEEKNTEATVVEEIDNYI